MQIALLQSFLCVFVMYELILLSADQDIQPTNKAHNPFLVDSLKRKKPNKRD